MIKRQSARIKEYQVVMKAAEERNAALHAEAEQLRGQVDHAVSMAGTLQSQLESVTTKSATDEEVILQLTQRLDEAERTSSTHSAAAAAPVASSNAQLNATPGLPSDNEAWQNALIAATTALHRQLVAESSAQDRKGVPQRNESTSHQIASLPPRQVSDVGPDGDDHPSSPQQLYWESEAARRSLGNELSECSSRLAMQMERNQQLTALLVDALEALDFAKKNPMADGSSCDKAGHHATRLKSEPHPHHRLMAVPSTNSTTTSSSTSSSRSVSPSRDEEARGLTSEHGHRDGTVGGENNAAMRPGSAAMRPATILLSRSEIPRATKNREAGLFVNDASDLLREDETPVAAARHDAQSLPSHHTKKCGAPQTIHADNNLFDTHCRTYDSLLDRMEAATAAIEAGLFSWSQQHGR